MPSRLRTLMAILAITLLHTATAQNYEIGLGSNYSDSLTINAHANIPLYNALELEHSLRPQLTYAFTGWPAASITYVLTSTTTAHPRYLGAGIGLTIPGDPLGGVLLSAHALAGATIPINNNFNAYTEVTLSTSHLATSLSIGAGIRYTLGGNN